MTPQFTPRCLRTPSSSMAGPPEKKSPESKPPRASVVQDTAAQVKALEELLDTLHSKSGASTARSQRRSRSPDKLLVATGNSLPRGARDAKRVEALPLPSPVPCLDCNGGDELLVDDSLSTAPTTTDLRCDEDRQMLLDVVHEQDALIAALMEQGTKGLRAEIRSLRESVEPEIRSLPSLAAIEGMGTAESGRRSVAGTDVESIADRSTTASSAGCSSRAGSCTVNQDTVIAALMEQATEGLRSEIQALKAMGERALAPPFSPTTTLGAMDCSRSSDCTGSVATVELPHSVKVSGPCPAKRKSHPGCFSPPSGSGNSVNTNTPSQGMAVRNIPADVMPSPRAALRRQVSPDSRSLATLGSNCTSPNRPSAGLVRRHRLSNGAPPPLAPNTRQIAAAKSGTASRVWTVERSQSGKADKPPAPRSPAPSTVTARRPRHSGASTGGKIAMSDSQDSSKTTGTKIPARFEVTICQDWSTKDVVRYIGDLNLEEFAPTFADHQVNGCALLALTDKDLKDTYKMGTDQRRRLLTAVRAIPHPESSPRPATAISRSPTPTHEGARTPVLLGRLSSGGSPSRCSSRGPKPEVKTDAKVNHTEEVDQSDRFCRIPSLVSSTGSTERRPWPAPRVRSPVTRVRSPVATVRALTPPPSRGRALLQGQRPTVAPQPSLRILTPSRSAAQRPEPAPAPASARACSPIRRAQSLTPPPTAQTLPSPTHSLPACVMPAPQFAMSCLRPPSMPTSVPASWSGDRREGLDLGGCFWTFCQANALHWKLKGGPSGQALYSGACCLSLSVDDQVIQCLGPVAGRALEPSDLARLPYSGVLVAPELPPQLPPGTSLRNTLEARLDLALGLLQAAVASGNFVERQMLQDADLRAVRDLRPSQFVAILQQVDPQGPFRG